MKSTFEGLWFKGSDSMSIFEGLAVKGADSMSISREYMSKAPI